ncbi:MAG TPA: hypothetical protein VN364_01925 [Bellilinea sp.]|nr:hypothetical protein [Bellilinea sp.]
MEIFGVGILEVLLILVIAIIVLGPEGMIKAAHSVGVFMRKVIKSPIWSQLMDTQRELRDMPTRLVREAGLEEDIKELKRTQQQLRNVDIKGAVASAVKEAGLDEGYPLVRPAVEPTIAPPQPTVPPEPEKPDQAPATPEKPAD